MTIERRRGGGNVPGRFGRVSATFPLASLVFDTTQLDLRVRPRLFGARDLHAVPGEVRVSAMKSMLGSPGIEFRVGADRWVFLTFRQQEVLAALRAAGYQLSVGGHAINQVTE
jgi:hypothetical protein